MLFPSTRNVACHLPTIFRACALAAFLAGVFLGYFDAQKMALQRMALSQDPPAEVPLATLVRDGAGALSGEVAVLADSGAARVVRFRQGLHRRSVLVYPLVAGAGDGRQIRGFAHVAPDTRGVLPPADGADSVALQGILGAPGPMTRAVARAFAADGLELSADPLTVALYDAPRRVVLSRTIRSPWRPVCYWLALLALIGSHILRVERRRIEAERGRMAVARAWAGQVAAPAQPATEKARSRFLQLAEADELAETPVAPRGLERVVIWARALLTRSTPEAP